MITMSSDGLPLSQAFGEAMARPMVSYDMRLFSNGADTGWDVMRAQLDLGAGGACDADTEDLTIGGTYSARLEARLAGSVTGVPGTELEVRVGVDVGGSHEYVTVAHVTASTAREWQGVTTVRASGLITAKMGVGAGLTAGTMAPAALASAIASASGVPVAVGAFATTSTEVSVSSSMTCRDALAALARRLGGFAAETHDGGVLVAPFSSAATFALDAGVVTSAPDLAAEDYVCDGLTVETSGDPITFGTGRAKVRDEYATQATAAAVWENVRGYEYLPGTVPVAIADPRVTPFDVAAVSLAGHVGNLPTQGISLTYDGGLFGTMWAAGLTAEAADEMMQGEIGRRLDEASAAAIGAAQAASDAQDAAEDALDAAQAAQAAAQAVGQHFWVDGTGAYVTEVTHEQWDDTGADPPGTGKGPNALLNSLGMLIRDGLDTLMAVLPTGVAIFDGQDDSNTVAEFAADHARIGGTGTANVLLSPNSLAMTDGSGLTLLDVERRPGNGTVHQVTETFQVTMNMSHDRLYGIDVTFSATPDTTSTVNVYVNGTICYEAVWDPDRLVMVPHFTDVSGGCGFYGHGISETLAFPNHRPDSSYSQTVTLEYDGDRTVHLSATMEGRDFQPTATWLPVATVTATYGVAGDAPSLTFGTRRPSAGVGLYSSSLGEGLIASQADQTVLGRYNVEDAQGDYALMVGNGTDDSARSNALAVAWNGDLSCGLVNGVDVTQMSGGVTGVKGDAEASYRTGNVNLTPANIGAQAALSVSSTTASRGTAASTIATNSVRRYGKLVEVTLGGIKLASALASGSTSGTVATVPSGYRPATDVYCAIGSTGAHGGSYAKITSGGVVTIRNSSGSQIATSAQLAFTICYVIA